MGVIGPDTIPIPKGQWYVWVAGTFQEVPPGRKEEGIIGDIFTIEIK